MTKKNMKSMFYEDMKDNYIESFLGAFNTLKHDEVGYWFKKTNFPKMSDEQLENLEMTLKSNEDQILQSVGTFGTKSVFYFDKKLGQFVGFCHSKKYKEVA